MNRREMIAACAALPFIGIVKENTKIVKWKTYNGPGKNENEVDPVWAEALILTSGKTKFDYYEYGSGIEIIRKSVNGCYLSKSTPEWFTAGSDESPDHWKEDHLWYGDVRLIKDIFHFRGEESKIDYYLCRGDNAIKFGRFNALFCMQNWVVKKGKL